MTSPWDIDQILDWATATDRRYNGINLPIHMLIYPSC